MRIRTAFLTEFSQDESDRYFEMMSEERKNSILRRMFESDRKSSIIGEALARKAISEISGLKEEDIIFARTENGKPFCENADVFFSISHSKDMIACAVSNNQIGIDVEFIRDIDFRITRFACNEKDMRLLDSCPNENEKTNLFFKIWTAKEAYIKCHGKILADIRDVVYEEILPRCQTYEENGYMISIYE